jgi:hypothetical protein
MKHWDLQRGLKCMKPMDDGRYLILESQTTKDTVQKSDSKNLSFGFPTQIQACEIDASSIQYKKQQR